MVAITGSNSLQRLDLSLSYNEFDLFMNMKEYIGTKVFKPRGVGSQSANAGKIPLEQLLTQRDTRASNRQNGNMDEFDIEAWFYSTEPYKWQAPIYDRELAIFRDVFDMEGTARNRLIGILCDHYERQAAEALYGVADSDGTLDTAVSHVWSAETATPIEDVFRARVAVRQRTGHWPNAMSCNKIQFFHLLNSPQIRDRVKWTLTPTPDLVSALLKDMFQLKYLFIAGGVTNSANAQADRAIADIWSTTKVAVFRVAESDDPREASIGRTFQWSGYGAAPGSTEAISVLVDQWRDEGNERTVFRGKSDRQIKLMYPEMCQLLTGVLDDTVDGFPA
jgi:hypothetical protein